MVPDTLKTPNVRTNVIDSLTSGSVKPLSFTDFTQIDFGNATLVRNFPSSGSGSGGFPLVNDRYEVDKSLDLDTGKRVYFTGMNDAQYSLGMDVDGLRLELDRSRCVDL